MCITSLSPLLARSLLPLMGGMSIASHRSQEQFTEFLVSITDAASLIRDGVSFDTSSFINRQTSKLNVILVAYATQHGIASEISITADLQTRVTASVLISNYRTIESAEDVVTLMALFAIAGLLVALGILNLVLRARAVRNGGSAGSTGASTSFAFILVDLVIILIASVYLAIAGDMSLRSSQTGLSVASALSINWKDTSEPYDSKISSVPRAISTSRPLASTFSRLCMCFSAYLATQILRLVARCPSFLAVF